MAQSESKQILLYLALGALGVVLLGLTINYSPDLIKKVQESPGPHLMINEERILVEVAETAEARAQGLSGRESLGKDEGVLFVFPETGRYGFWMKEMKFNLDFIFIKDEEVVFLVENVPFPEEGEEPVRVNSEANFNKVLEVNEGVIKKLDIKIGDKIELFL